jgi:Transposase, Mutator family
VEAFLAEALLAGLSARDLARITEKHLGQKYDSKQVSRSVARVITELKSWRQRSLWGKHYKFLYLDGASFQARINGHIGRQSFCAVLGITSEELVLRTYRNNREVGITCAGASGRGHSSRNWRWACPLHKNSHSGRC